MNAIKLVSQDQVGTPEVAALAARLTPWQRSTWEASGASAACLAPLVKAAALGLVPSEKPEASGTSIRSVEVVARILGFESFDDYSVMVQGDAGLSPGLFRVWQKGSSRKEALVALKQAWSDGRLA